MATLIVPITNEPYSEVKVSLDGTVYVLVFRWNTRDGAWYLDIADSEGTLLKPGIKLVCDWPLTAFRDTNPELPPGMLSIFDTSGGQTDPVLDDLGTRCLLLYEEANAD